MGLGAALMALALAPVASPVCAAWESLGPGGGGWLWSLAVAPDEHGTIFLGCDVGGVYRSTDYGSTWHIINNGLSQYYVQALAVDPTQPMTVYAGTRGGVCKSTDGGETWELRRAGFPPTETWGISAPVAAVALDPTDPTRLLAGIGEPRTGRLGEGTRGGIYLSRDAAETWQFVEEPPELARAQVFSVVFAPAAPGLVLAATDAGAYRSEDAGLTWARSSEGLPEARAMEIAADAAPGVFYVTFHDPASRTGGVARSDDGGASWRVVREGENREGDFWRIVTDPTAPGTVYASVRNGSGIHRSTDGGDTWERITRDDNVRSAWFYRGTICTALALDPRDPQRLYYANDMEIYGTADGGETWDQLCTDVVRPASPEQPALWRGRGVETTCSSALAVAPGHPGLLWLGYWDVGLWRSTDGGHSFAWVNQWMGYGKAAAVATDPGRPWRVWLSFGRNYGPHRIWRTDDYGRDWRLVGYEDTGLPQGAVFSLAFDPGGPDDDGILYAPVDRQGVFRSADGGETWERADEQDWGLCAFTRIATVPQVPGRLLLGTRFARDAERTTIPGGVWRSDDAGRTWARVGDLPERPVPVAAPSNPQTLYAGERDFSSIGRGGVYRSDDGGHTWRMMAERLDEGLGNIARTFIAAVQVNPRDESVVYASSVDEGYDLNRGKGIFVSRDGGETWESMNEGLTQLNCHDLLIDPNDPARLYAGTAGNGFFRRGPAPGAAQLPPAPAAALPPDPLCVDAEGWTCTADRLAEIEAHDDQFWWGRGHVTAHMDTTGHGARLIRRLGEGPQGLDISGARVVSLRIRGLKADGTELCISRMMMYDDEGRRLLYEPDIIVGPTWTRAEVPLRDWEGEGFNHRAVVRYEFEFWAPYPEGRPYEFSVGGLRFR